jgi:hypothetical membrane protein
MFKKQIKNMHVADWLLAKLGVASLVLFLVSAWPAGKEWVLSVNPWYFFIVAVLSVAIVQFRIWKK